MIWGKQYWKNSQVVVSFLFFFWLLPSVRITTASKQVVCHLPFLIQPGLEPAALGLQDCGTGNASTPLYLKESLFQVLKNMLIKMPKYRCLSRLLRRQFCEMAAKPIPCLCCFWQFTSHRWSRSLPALKRVFRVQQVVRNQKRCGKKEKTSAALTCCSMHYMWDRRLYHNVSRDMANERDVATILTLRKMFKLNAESWHFILCT